MKEDLADKESLEARRAQQEEESRENSKLISEQKAVRSHNRLFKYSVHVSFIVQVCTHCIKVVWKEPFSSECFVRR